MDPQNCQPPSQDEPHDTPRCTLEADMSTYVPEAYRSALALNNMATALMQRGFYIPAIKTLTDSLTMMQAAFVGTDETMQDTKKRCPRHTMKVASQRYVKTVQSNQGNWSPLEAEADPIDDDDFAALRAAATYGPSSTIVFPIRISQSALDEADSAGLKRQFGILLYNHALAHFLASKTSTTSSSKHLRPKRLMKRAYKSYRMAEATFLRIMEDGEQEQDQPSTDLSTMLLSAIVLNGVSLIFHSQDLTNKAQEAQETVTFLCSSVDEDYITDMLIQRHCASAA